MSSCQVLGRNRGVDRQDKRHAQEVGDRREILRRIERHLLVQARIDHDRRARRDQQRVAVGRGLGDHGRADVAAGAAAVVDDERLLHRFGEPLAIGRAAMSEGPPGGHGTMIVTGLVGYACAKQPPRSRASTIAPSKRGDARMGRRHVEASRGSGPERVESTTKPSGHCLRSRSDVSLPSAAHCGNYGLDGGRPPCFLRRRTNAAGVGPDRAHHHGVRLRRGPFRSFPALARRAARPRHCRRRLHDHLSNAVGIALVLIGVGCMILGAVQHRSFVATLPAIDVPRSHAAIYPIVLRCCWRLLGSCSPFYLAHLASRVTSQPFAPREGTAFVSPPHHRCSRRYVRGVNVPDPHDAATRSRRPSCHAALAHPSRRAGRQLRPRARRHRRRKPRRSSRS